MSPLGIYADFQNADPQGRLRLNCVGTQEDLASQRIELRDGLILTLYSDDADEAGRQDDLMVNGVVSFSNEEQIWVATIDWAAICHASSRSDHGAANRQPAQPGTPELTQPVRGR